MIIQVVVILESSHSKEVGKHYEKLRMTCLIHMFHNLVI